MADAEQAPRGQGDSKVTVAGLYDVVLGGTRGTQAEREAVERIRLVMPEVDETVWANRAFHQRSTIWLVQQGIRQFIDLGSGLPTQDNTHQVAQRHAPDARVVYVDWDQDAAALGAELVAGDPNAEFVHADIRSVDTVLAAPGLRKLIDFDQPVGVLATGLVYFLSDRDDPWSIIARYRDAVAPGSYVAVSHVTADKMSSEPVMRISDVYRRSGSMIYFRNREQVEWFFQGMDLVAPYEGADPKVTYVGYWFCEDPALADDDSSRWLYAGVGRVR